MASSIKKKFLFFFFVTSVSAFVLFFPDTSLAGTVYYTTECGETFEIGSYSEKKCHTCCDEYSCWKCCPCCDQYSCSGEWEEYKASTSGCDPNILIRTCRSVCGPASACCGCGECQVECSDWEICEDCGSWQKAKRAGCEMVTKWGLTKPRCVCSGCADGECCVAAPTGLRYYDNPNYPTDPCSPEGGIGSINIRLPVKLDWDDVEGWKDGWCDSGGYQLADACGSMTTISSGGTAPWKACCIARHEACVEYESSLINWDELNACQKRSRLSYIKYTKCEWQQYITECVKEEWSDPDPEESFAGPDDVCETEDCPYPNLVYNPSELVQYYEITITGEMRDDGGSAMPTFTARLDKSEFIPPNPCFFKSNRLYTWSVRACCGNGDCGPAATSTFTTSLAPEPVWPHDPDWAGPDRAEPIWEPPTEKNPYPIHLEWCPVDEAKSYCLRMYKPGTPFIRMYGQGTPFCPTLYSELSCPAVIPPGKEFPVQPYFDFSLDVFTKETDYQWKVATCLNQEGQKCGLSCPEDKICYTFETLKSECGCCDFSQLWNFYGQTVLLVPRLISPKDGQFVNFTHNLEWTRVPGANSYRYEIYQINGAPSLLINESIVEEYISIRDLWDKGILALDTKYTWRVQPCWDEKGKDCQKEIWSDEWEFTTTGAVPTGPDPSDGAVDVLIPINLNWDDMGGAASYNYKLALDSGFDNIITEGMLAGFLPPASEISINYDSSIQHPKQKTTYYWQINTCINMEGNICGNWTSGNFTTFELRAPENPHPSNGGEFYTNEHYLKWSPVLGGAFYEYEIIGKIGPTIVPSNYAFIDTSVLDIETVYTWRVRACLDENCQEAGPLSDDWTFTLVEGEAPGAGGIVPCGRYADNPDTPSWNERDPCGVEHIFIMIFLIVELLLWKAIPVVLALLALASGVIFYFSGQLGVSSPVIQVKSLWKAAGLGLAVVFLAWTGISLILGLFGYQVGLFGDWWRIEF